jgi:hypothetical protein
MLSLLASPNIKLNEEDIRGHEIVEIAENGFNANLGGIKKHRYFRDGNFYPLMHLVQDVSRN